MNLGSKIYIGRKGLPYVAAFFFKKKQIMTSVYSSSESFILSEAQFDVI